MVPRGGAAFAGKAKGLESCLSPKEFDQEEVAGPGWLDSNIDPLIIVPAVGPPVHTRRFMMRYGFNGGVGGSVRTFSISSLYNLKFDFRST